jgi:hypothetical protein
MSVKQKIVTATKKSGCKYCRKLIKATGHIVICSDCPKKVRPLRTGVGCSGFARGLHATTKYRVMLLPVGASFYFTGAVLNRTELDSGSEIDIEQLQELLNIASAFGDLHVKVCYRP